MSLKVMLLYSFCYLFYTMIFVAICFASNTYIPTQQPISQPGLSLNALRGWDLEEIYQGLLNRIIYSRKFCRNLLLPDN